jgi:hypothetical protein
MQNSLILVKIDLLNNSFHFQQEEEHFSKIWLKFEEQKILNLLLCDLKMQLEEYESVDKLGEKLFMWNFKINVWIKIAFGEAHNDCSDWKNPTVERKQVLNQSQK